MVDPTQTPPPVVQPRRRHPGRWRAWLGGLLILTMIGGGWALVTWDAALVPVRVIAVDGQIHDESSRMLRETIGARLTGGMLTADLADLKAAADELPWVAKAAVRRDWPDRLRVQVEEHRPIASWNADGLVTAEGVVFRPGNGRAPAGLPMLEGEDPRAPEVVERYLRWRDELMLIGHLIQTLSVDPRGAWRIELVTGLEIHLGTEAVEERLARFIASATQLEAAGQPEVVDMRYSNGFAVRWATHADEQSRATVDRTMRSDTRG